jgi:hypothetical protein
MPDAKQLLLLTLPASDNARPASPQINVVVNWSRI